MDRPQARGANPRRCCAYHDSTKKAPWGGGARRHGVIDRTTCLAVLCFRHVLHHSGGTTCLTLLV